jgi:hypothetical protein
MVLETSTLSTLGTRTVGTHFQAETSSTAASGADLDFGC